ncbi:MAG: 4-(cytidine 5'-diphospho)-2-C-methyl-D-erythritol kinase [Proteobacteria bacterium]|nr:4-(cytidine 5'-diphospho)-2-C-methyl-D-erythritol kinase [Pseudomonadota bacterium]MBU1420431.1 4-(cytidine 5'-diphospho)-2-C-methyl-D-erythritol kinase [Pseudomonadota bacterium]MBU1456366.1 4-(cytidine 5'-diphospho)-2-C-methyl-D-erythritol kinase [Pseudomonadota bacterium]
MAEVYGEALVVRAPAKVNLTLRILGKRPDGYHNLDSVMQKIELADIISIRCSKQPGIHLSCPGSDLPENESNLVWKAAAAFLRATDRTADCGVSIVLEKHIPVAAGLGGGSSDAGAVLTGLNRLLHADLSEDALLDLGRSLGADVPFFVVPHHAVRATGIGDKMIPVFSLSDCTLLLVNPGFSVSTAWVYKNFTLTRADKVSNLSDSRKKDNLSELPDPLFNDLEKVTIERYPELAVIKNFLLDNGASGALMSGSGPTVFGVFPDSLGVASSDLHHCADELTKKYGSGVFITRVLCN